MFEYLEALNAFLERGGTVLYLILVLTTILWGFVIERLWYITFNFSRELEVQMRYFEEIRHSSHFIRRSVNSTVISKANFMLNKNMEIIKSLTSLASLFGLLGTVTGMIYLFDSISFFGTSSARAVASGVSMATIPTLSGMVASISGLAGLAIIKTMIKRKENSVLKELEL